MLRVVQFLFCVLLSSAQQLVYVDVAPGYKCRKGKIVAHPIFSQDGLDINVCAEVCTSDPKCVAFDHCTRSQRAPKKCQRLECRLFASKPDNFARGSSGRLWCSPLSPLSNPIIVDVPSETSKSNTSSSPTTPNPQSDTDLIISVGPAPAPAPNVHPPADPDAPAPSPRPPQRNVVGPNSKSAPLDLDVFDFMLIGIGGIIAIAILVSVPVIAVRVRRRNKEVEQDLQYQSDGQRYGSNESQ